MMAFESACEEPHQRNHVFDETSLRRNVKVRIQSWTFYIAGVRYDGPTLLPQTTTSWGIFLSCLLSKKVTLMKPVSSKLLHHAVGFTNPRLLYQPREKELLSSSHRKYNLEIIGKSYVPSSVAGAVVGKDFRLKSICHSPRI